MKKTYYTDRSRADAYQRCPTQRYLGYHYDGKGIRINKVNLDIVVGVAVHEGLGELLMRYTKDLPSAWEFDVNVDAAVVSALARLNQELSSTPFDLSEFTEGLADDSNSQVSIPGLILPTPGLTTNSPDARLTYTIDETRALVELLVRSYAYAPSGLSWLLREYEILEVEQEDHFTLHQSNEFDIEFMARADGLLRRRVDGALVVLSFKTTKSWDTRKQDSAASDMQGMSEVVSIEERLRGWKKRSRFSKIQPDIPQWFSSKYPNEPENIEGVQMIYLLTSESRKDVRGFKQRSSGLLRPWIMNTFEGQEYAFTSSWTDGEGKSRRLGKDWSRVNSWELAGGVKDYVDMIKDSHDDALGGNPLDSIIIIPQLHRREPEKLEQWKREITAQEVKVANGLNYLSHEEYSEEIKEIVRASTFPHHTHSCVYPSKCQFYQICWGSRFESEDPLGSGYKHRVPHHDIEKENIHGDS